VVGPRTTTPTVAVDWAPETAAPAAAVEAMAAVEEMAAVGAVASA